MNRRLGWLLSGLLVIGILLGFQGTTNAASQGPTFRSVQSGPWSDPATWGHTGPPQADVTIPGPTSDVIIAQGTTVTLASPQQMNTLIVEGGGVVRGIPGADVNILATTTIRNSGSIIGGNGSTNHAAGSVFLKTNVGSIYNEGLIWGGAGGRYGGPGGAVSLMAYADDVENWGEIRGGKGGANATGGWVMLSAPAGIVRNRGEVHGGASDEADAGGNVLLRAVTVDMIQGRVQGGEGAAAYGDVTLSADEAILASGRRMRLSGQNVYAIVNQGMLDLHNIETMSVLAREDIWLIGQNTARLNLIGNQARFAPLHPLNGVARVWFDPEHRYFDTGLGISDIVSGTVDVSTGRSVAIPRLLPQTWGAGRPGEQVQWTAQVINMGNAAAPIQVQVGDTLGWNVTVEPANARLLLPGERRPVTITVQIPPNAPVGVANTLTLEARAGANAPLIDRISLPLPVKPPPTYLPWLGHRAQVGVFLHRTAHSTQAPQVELTWPGAEQGKGLAGRSLLLLVDRSGGQDVVGGNIAYWDGLRWVPIATTSDMENLVEDGIWTTLWDTRDLPLNFVYIRARLWNGAGEMGEVVRAVPLYHAPVAQGNATFQEDGSVLLDASASTDLDNDIESYRWDVGDAQILEGQQVTYRFPPGTHVVRLWVRDATGLTSEAVYLLDADQATWEEQTACGCTSIRLLSAGTAPLPLPWEDDAHQVLGLDVAPLAVGQLARFNLALEATLTPGSNPRYCRVAQWGRSTWRWQEGGQEYVRARHWNGQRFPETSQEGANGLIGYTQPSTLLEAENGHIRWVLAPGWGWRVLNQGLPTSAFGGTGVRLVGTYRADIAGGQGSCACTWHITVTVPATGTPSVDVQSDCP